MVWLDGLHTKLINSQIFGLVWKHESWNSKDTKTDHTTRAHASHVLLIGFVNVGKFGSCWQSFFFFLPFSILGAKSKTQCEAVFFLSSLLVRIFSVGTIACGSSNGARRPTREATWSAADREIHYFIASTVTGREDSMPVMKQRVQMCECSFALHLFGTF